MSEISLKEMREIDLNAMFLGKDALELMENAGRACYEEISRLVDKKSKILIICGLGNNGGDGFVLARYLFENGYDVRVLIIDKGERIKTEEARINYNRIKDRVKIYEGEFSEEIFNVDVIVDAILGTGIKGTLRGKMREIVDKINRSRAMKISIDVPTGIGSDLYVRADYVITFYKMKRELKGFNVIVKDIGIPKEAEEYYFFGNAILNLPIRSPESYKGRNGKVLIIGGSKRYHGALIFSALSAINSGCDLVYTLVPEVLEDTVRDFPEIIPVIYSGEHLNYEAINYFEDIYKKVDVILIGNGLDYNEEIRKTVVKILEIIDGEKPVIIDADGIKCVRGLNLKNCILTPHAKEFELLFDVNPGGDIEYRKEIVKKYSKDISSTILLKGRYDVISDGERVKINVTGNEGMTVGGTGDVLAGLISSLVSQGVDNFNAACLGAFVNGIAGDILFKKFGYSYTAMDLIFEIKKVLRFLYEMRWKMLKK